MSPKRPRSHILEDESRQRFPLALPNAWVVREIPKDYGIDVEVEVFEDEEATGLTFKVQLKSTESATSSLPKLQVDMDHLRYWSKLDVPVMIVLYVQDEGAFYWCWSKGLELAATKATQKSIVLTFDRKETLSLSASSRIVDDLEILRSLNQRILRHPLPIRLTSTLQGVSTGKLITNFREWLSANNLRGRLEVVVKDVPYQASVTLGPRRWRASLPLNWVSLGLNAEQCGAETEAECGALFASLLASAGFTDLAISMFHASIRDARIWHSSAILDAMVQFIVRHGEYDLGIAAARSLWSEGGLRNYNHISDLMSPAIQNSIDLGEDAASASLEILLEIAAAALALGESRLAGMMFFNAAGIMKHRNPAEAAKLFTWAVELKSEYGHEARFWAQRGDCMFRAGNPAQSADDYITAMLLDPTCAIELTPECADALLYSGRFAECLELLDRTGTIEHRLDRLAVVDRLTARTVMTLTGLERQERNLDTGESDIEDPLALLVEFDALDPVAWERLIQARPDASLDLLVSNARIQCKSAGAWISAAVEAFASSADSRTRKAILEQGLVDGHPDFYDGVLQIGVQQLPSDKSRELLRMLDRLAESAPEHRPLPWIFSGKDDTPPQKE